MTFHQRLRQAAKGKSPEDVCRILKISRFTYDRWITGISAPYEFGREAVFKALKQL